MAALMSSALLLNVVLVVVGVILLAGAFSARLIIRPGRAHVWSTPKSVGLDYEDITFKAQDGVNLVGWFMPAPERAGKRAPVIISLHGWPWCRMGTQANSLINDLPGSRPVHLLPFFKLLHDEGYSVLAADHRNFGDSPSAGVITGGWLESYDLLGELDFLETRSDVDMNRVGVVGFSQGGTTLIFAGPQTDRIKAGIAVQPTSANVFAVQYAKALMGPLALIINPLSQLFYSLAGGPSLSSIKPALAAAGVRFPILFVQGTGDRWGTVADVEHMASMAPLGTAIYPETSHRFEGYTWVLDNPEVTMNFFRTHLAAPASAPPLPTSPALSAAALVNLSREIA
jgi:dipeptidyl aminopeptidase/acylaminoacyl peptidase